MKRFLCLVLGLSLIACSGTKQANTTTAVTEEISTTPPPQKPTPRSAGRQRPDLSKLMTQLNLSKEQEVEFEAIHNKYRTKMQTLRQDQSLERAGKRAAMKDLRTAQTTELKAVLTTTQFELYTKLMEERRSNNRRNREQRSW